MGSLNSSMRESLRRGNRSGIYPVRSPSTGSSPVTQQSPSRLRHCDLQMGFCQVLAYFGFSIFSFFGFIQFTYTKLNPFFKCNSLLEKKHKTIRVIEVREKQTKSESKIREQTQSPGRRKMDAKLNELAQNFGRFKAAFISNDFDTSANLLSDLKQCD